MPCYDKNLGPNVGFSVNIDHFSADQIFRARRPWNTVQWNQLWHWQSYSKNKMHHHFRIHV